MKQVSMTLAVMVFAVSAHAGPQTQNIADMCAAKADGHEHREALCNAGDVSVRGVSTVSPERVPAAKKTDLGLYLAAVDAAKMIKEHPKDVLFLDVRTREEAAFLGMPTVVDANVPYMVPNSFAEWDERRNTFALEVNGAFAADVAERLAQKGLGRDAHVVLICRSGDRSAKAASLLAKLGYTTVYSVIDGYEGDMGSDGRRSVNGWKNEGLPWSYKLEKTKMVMTKR